MPWDFSMPVKIYFGNDKVKDLPQIIDSFGFERGVLVCSNTLKNNGVADEIMKNLLGIDKTTSPTDCYAHWQNNLKPEYRSTLKSMVTEMINSEKVVQVEYEWAHPKYGNIIVRCSGRCSEKKNNIILLEGFHRVISDISKS